MAADQPSDDRQRSALTFSLGTLFLIMASVGVGAVAFRAPYDASFGLRMSLAMVFVGAFLTVWFVATLQFKRMRFSGALLVVGLLCWTLLPPQFDVGPRYCPNVIVPSAANWIGIAQLSPRLRQFSSGVCGGCPRQAAL